MLKATYQEVPADFPVKSGLLDGMAIIYKDDKPLGLLYSDWVEIKPAGKLLLLEPRSVRRNTPISLDIPHGPAGGPADFFYNPKDFVLALPCMLDGRVLLLELEL